MLAICAIFIGSLLLASGQAEKACGEAGVACYGLPHGCADADSNNCDILAKITQSPTSPAAVRVTLTGISNGPQHIGSFINRWIAVGFSEDGKMSKSSVITCLEDGGQAVAKLTWNLADGNANVGWSGIDQSPLVVVNNSLDPSKISCIVDLNKRFTIHNHPVDLTKNVSLIAATGPITEGAVQVHDPLPGSSGSQKFSF